MVRSTEAIGAFALDADGNVVLVSPMAESVSGYDFSALRNHHYLEYVPAELAPEATQNFESAMSGKRIEGAVEILTAGGGTVEIGYTAQPDRDSDGQVIGITGTVWLSD